MRFLGRLLLLLLAVATLWAAGRLDWQSLLRRFSATPDETLREQPVRVSTLYLLTDESWTSFDLPGGGEMIRLVSNANVPSETEPGEPVAYAVHYQLLNRQGEGLAAHVYHHNSKIVPHLNPETGDREPSAYYIEGSELPAEGRIAMVNLRGLKGVSRLRLRLGIGDERVRQVGVRVYAPEKTAEHKLGFFWQRLTERQKQALAEGSVYPHELLLPEEKLNLARRLWRPLGPVGVVGRDYASIQLYLRQDGEEARFDEPILPAGLLVDNGRYGVIPLAEGENRLRLRLLPTPSAAGTNPGVIRLRWYGSSAEAPRQWELPWSDEAMYFTETLAGGLLEIEAPAPLTARVYRIDKEQEREITPEPVYNRSYRPSSDRPLNYTLVHVGDSATPLRVDLRLLFDPARPPAGSVAVGYELRDATGKPVRTGTLEVPLVPSGYDRLADAAAPDHLSDPARFYFRLPPPVAEIRFVADAPVLVAAYTRPPDLEREVRVPEDYLPLADEEQRQPAWFGLRPADYETLLRENRSTLLLLQRRPPEADAADLEIRSGRYLWEDFHPQGSWLARQVVTPVSGDRPTRPEALGSTYRPLPVGRETALELRDAYDQPFLAPELLYLRDTTEPTPFALLVDGRLHHQGLLVGREGELSLPPLPAGRRRVMLETDSGGRFLLDSAAGSGPAFLKRLVNRLDGGGLTFTINHGVGAETLSGWLFVPYETRERSRLRVTLLDLPAAGSGPIAEWTFARRRFDLAPAPGPPVPVLQAAGARVDGGQAFFIPLGGDLPAGRYRLRVDLEAGPGGYLLLSRLTPGLNAERVLLRERDLVREPTDD